MEYKFVPAKRMHPGDAFLGWKIESCHTFAAGVIKEVNPFKVRVIIFPGPNQREEEIDAEAFFKVEMTEKEFKEKYRETAKGVASAFKNKLHLDEIGYHEMDNHWLSCCPYEMAAACQKMGVRIIGICTAVTPKPCLFGTSICDIGVCAEYLDGGERFWCHWFSEDINNISEMEI